MGDTEYVGKTQQLAEIGGIRRNGVHHRLVVEPDGGYEVVRKAPVFRHLFAGLHVAEAEITLFELQGQGAMDRVGTLGLQVLQKGGVIFWILQVTDQLADIMQQAGQICLFAVREAELLRKGGGSGGYPDAVQPEIDQFFTIVRHLRRKTVKDGGGQNDAADGIEPEQGNGLGNRTGPTAAHGRCIGIMQYSRGQDLVIGQQFSDGRETGLFPFHQPDSFHGNGRQGWQTVDLNGRWQTRFWHHFPSCFLSRSFSGMQLNPHGGKQKEARAPRPSVISRAAASFCSGKDKNYYIGKIATL